MWCRFYHASKFTSFCWSKVNLYWMQNYLGSNIYFGITMFCFYLRSWRKPNLRPNVWLQSPTTRPIRSETWCNSFHCQLFSCMLVRLILLGPSHREVHNGLSKIKIQYVITNMVNQCPQDQTKGWNGATFGCHFSVSFIVSYDINKEQIAMLFSWNIKTNQNHESVFQNRGTPK